MERGPTHRPVSPQNKLMTLKQNVDVGAQLDKDQREAVKRLDEVTIQLEVVKDLQKQFTAITVDVSVSVCVRVCVCMYVSVRVCVHACVV